MNTTAPPVPPPLPSPLLTGLDLTALYVATAVAFTISLLVTLRARSLQRQQGIPLSGWEDLVVDTLIGALFGSLGSLALAHWFPLFRNGPSLLLAAGIISAFAPRITDWLREDGVGMLKGLLRHFVTGMSSALEEDKDDGSKKH